MEFFGTVGGINTCKKRGNSYKETIGSKNTITFAPGA
jgi:hypothetical protein